MKSENVWQTISFFHVLKDTNGFSVTFLSLYEHEDSSCVGVSAKRSRNEKIVEKSKADHHTLNLYYPFILWRKYSVWNLNPCILEAYYKDGVENKI